MYRLVIAYVISTVLWALVLAVVAWRRGVVALKTEVDYVAFVLGWLVTGAGIGVVMEFMITRLHQ